MPDANPVNPIYSYQNAYHQADQNGSFSRTVRVTATLNNPLTLTGSFANNAAFMVINNATVSITASNAVSYVASNFTTGQIYPIQVSYISASAAGDISVLYY